MCRKARAKNILHLICSAMAIEELSQHQKPNIPIIVLDLVDDSEWQNSSQMIPNIGRRHNSAPAQFLDIPKPRRVLPRIMRRRNKSWVSFP